MILLPFSDFNTSAAAFSPKALDHQLDEMKKVLTTMMEGENILMLEHQPWGSYPWALAHYGEVMCEEYSNRTGATHPASEYFNDVLAEVGDYSLPWWRSLEQVFNSHRGIMTRKKLGVSPMGDENYPVIIPVMRYGLKLLVVESGE